MIIMLLAEHFQEHLLTFCKYAKTLFLLYQQPQTFHKISWPGSTPILQNPFAGIPWKELPVEIKQNGYFSL